MASITRAGMRVVPGRNNKLSGFTPYKIYEVIAGYGDLNQSESISQLLGVTRLSERAMNVRNDEGKICFVTLDFFREFRLESNFLFHE